MNVPLKANVTSLSRGRPIACPKMRSSCSRTSVRLDDSVLMPTVSPSVSLPVAKGSTGTVSSSSSKAQEFDVLSLQLSHFGNRSVNKFDQLLHEAVIKNDAQRVQTLLAAGVSTNSTIHVSHLTFFSFSFSSFLSNFNQC